MSPGRKFARMVAGSKFTLVDVGASGGVHRRWLNLDDLIRVVGFEPDGKEFVKLQQSDRQVWFNTALSHTCEKRVLHLTKAQTNTSFFKPNLKVLSQLQWSPHEPVQDHDIVADIEVQCETLDSVLAARGLHPDYLKVDTQGSELEILRGAEATLVDDILIAEIEVEFAEIYEKQPLFADVDVFMRDRGFVLHDLGNFLYMKPRGLAGIGGAKGRIIAADALYLKDFSSDCTQLYEQGESKVYAAIAGYLAYGYPELGIHLLNNLKKEQCEIPMSGEIIQLLQRVKSTDSSFLHNVPGMSKLARLCGNIWFKYRKSEHCLWDVPLGN
jgi:FkbM family methyltransferase